MANGIIKYNPFHAAIVQDEFYLGDFYLGDNTSINKTITSDVSLLVGAYGARGLMYTVHKDGGVYPIKEFPGITVSLSGSILTIANSEGHTWRMRIIGI